MDPNSKPSVGLAIASLVLGSLALFLSPFLIGVIFGAIGFVLGLIQLGRGAAGRGMAIAGITLSIVGLVLTSGFGFFYYKIFKAIESAQGRAADFSAWERKPAPDITLTDLDGKTFKLSDFRGKRVVLDFWATWCPPCRKEIPHFVRLVKDTLRDELVIVGISEEDQETLKAFVRKEDVNYPIARADSLPEPYKDIHSIPTTFFIDRNGVIQKIAVGYHDFDELKTAALGPDSGNPPPAPAP